MKRFIIALLFPLALSAQNSNPASGKWIDTTLDTQQQRLAWHSIDDGQSLLLTEDFEVLQTHEICASITGYFFDKSQSGRYTVNFHGMRTTAPFIFTTRFDAEHWVTRYCTAQSLLSIK